MIKGIITQTKGMGATGLLNLRYEGFNGIALILGQFYDNIPDLNYQQRTADRMFEFYQTAKKVGFNHFLVDISGGLGKLDGNYWWKVIVDKFYKCMDIIFIIDEAYERVIEQGLYNKGRFITTEQFEEYQKEVDSYIFCKGQKIAWGSTIRNVGKLLPPIDFISSYDYKQNQKWNPYTAFVLMYGELKIGGSLRYKSLLAKARIINIKVAYLYQYDSAVKFNIVVPYTWFNSLLQLIGLYKPFCKWMRKRFIKA